MLGSVSSCMCCLFVSCVHHVAVLNAAFCMSCDECDVLSLYFMWCSVNVSVCFVCCVYDSVCELFSETIRNMFGCGCYFVVEYYASVWCG